MAATEMDVNGLSRGEQAYLYKDYGANYFGLGFTHYVDGYLTSTSVSTDGFMGMWGVSGYVEDFRSMYVNGLTGCGSASRRTAPATW